MPAGTKSKVKAGRPAKLPNQRVGRRHSRTWVRGKVADAEGCTAINIRWGKISHNQEKIGDPGHLRVEAGPEVRGD